MAFRSRKSTDGFANIDADKWNLEELRQQILDFHATYYSANIMTLTIMSERPLHEIRDIIEPHFSTIPNKEVERPLFAESNETNSPLDKAISGNIYYLKGYIEPPKFSMAFQLKSEKYNASFHPLEFFSMFLNYFSENSFKETLIKESLISSFSDSVVLQDFANSLYIVNFNLTPTGKKHS